MNELEPVIFAVGTEQRRIAHPLRCPFVMWVLAGLGCGFLIALVADLVW